MSMMTRPSRVWTPAQLDVLIEMYEAGVSAGKIADVLGMATDKVVEKLTVLELVIRSPKIALPPSDWRPNLDNEKLYPS